jgi:hypothetical protein
LADLDGDGRQEIFQATSAGGLYGFDDDGGLLAGFPLLTDGPVAVSPVAGGLIGEASGGAIQLAALAGSLLYLWDPATSLSGQYSGGPVAWGQAGSSAAGTNAVVQTAASGDRPPNAAALLPADRAYCYPNPVGIQGDVHFRFFLSRAASLDLQVFDALGEREQRIRVGGVPQPEQENEIVWSTSGYASGLYLCRLKARGEDGTKSEVVVRLAVSR